jgi:hypothetical protein
MHGTGPGGAVGFGLSLSPRVSHSSTCEPGVSHSPGQPIIHQRPAGLCMASRHQAYVLNLISAFPSSPSGGRSVGLEWRK